MSFDPHVAALIVSTAAAGLLMTLAGVCKNGLEWRQRRRFCPSCGRDLHVCACRN
jgi:NADH pyrophosphatase NudC (nudix superfamily)